MTNTTRGIATDDDPFGIKNVSGFYGPGAWIAWCLTLASSWVAVIRNDQSHNTNHFVYLLYINWAAIDVIRLTVRNLAKGTDPNSEQTTLTGPLGAALVVTWWGITHAALQYNLSTSSVHDYFAYRHFDYWPSNSLVKRKYNRPRRLLLALGIILPTIAGLVGNIGLVESGLGGIVPSLYWTDMKVSNIGYLGILNGLHIFAIGLALLPDTAIPRSVDEETAAHIITFAVKCGIWAGCAGSAFGMLLLYIFRLIASGGASWTKSCVLMPCAPQSLLDWDQAFPALVGVIMVGYEFRAAVLRGVRQYMPVVRQKLKELVENFNDRLRGVRMQRPWPRRVKREAETERYYNALHLQSSDSSSYCEEEGALIMSQLNWNPEYLLSGET
jgi:hypothetical protein